MSTPAFPRQALAPPATGPLARLPAPLRGKGVLFAAYLAVAFLVMGANPFRGESITPLDALATQHAFSWIDPGVEPRFGERSDILNALLPSWIDARRQLREGRVPLWNDGVAGGSTHLVPNTSVFTPAFAVFAAAPTPALGFHLAIVLNLAIAGLGMHLFLRRHVGGVAAACGALTFMFCGFHAAWLYWPHVHTAVWAPWLLLAIERCVQRPAMGTAIGIGIATTMVVLGGFPFVAEMILCMGGLYFLMSWGFGFHDRDLRLRLPVWYAAGSALGLLLCAPVVVELANWLAHYDLGYRQNRGSYLRFEHVSRLLPPWSYEFKRVEQTMYVGLVMTACAATTLLVSIARPARMSRIAAFGVLLLVITAGLVFGLWPLWLVGWFPGMGFNSWSRTIGVMDVAIIILGTLALDRLWKAGCAAGSRRTTLAIVVCVLALLQVVEQAHFFRRYNGPVPAAYFFPELPALRYVQERVGPFDYVVADSSFGIAGELGAYGLRDWFAHQIRTPAHKDALGTMVPGHRRSHTASRFRASAIDSDASALSDFNVRFLVVDSHDRDAVGPARRKITTRTPAPQQPGPEWVQYFDIGGEDGVTLRGISLRMATYMEKGLRGRVELAVASESGPPLAAVRIDARTVSDNQFAEFFFPEPVPLAPGRYLFKVVYTPSEQETRPLTAWILPPTSKTSAALRAGSQPLEGELEFLLHVGDGIRGNYRHAFTAAGLSVFESMRTPNGPYFLADMLDVAGPEASSSIRVEHYEPAAFRLRYTGQQAGYVVVPQILTRDWQVSVEGRRAVPRLKAGVMPAVVVAGPSTIEFRYEPWNLRALLAWATSLVALLGLMAFAQHHFQKRDGPRKETGT